MIAYKVFSVILLMDIFRMPFLASIDLQMGGFLFHFAVLISFLFLYHKISLSFKNVRFFIGWLLISGIGLSLLAIRGMDFKVAIKSLGSIIIPAIFPILGELLSVDKTKLKKSLEAVLAIGFYFGASYLVLDYLVIHVFKLISQCDVANQFFGSYNNQYCLSSRKMPVGFLVFKDISLAFVMGAFFAFKEWKHIRVVSVRFLLILTSIIVVDSIVLSGIFLIVLLFRFPSFLKKHFQLSLFALLSFLFMAQFSSTYMRIIGYLVNELNLNRFLPSVEKCSWGNFLVSMNGMNGGCSSREIHSLLYLFKFGLLPSIGWYAFIVFNLLLLLRSLKTKSSPYLMYFNLTLIFAMIHYSGLEAWGINFIVVLIFYLSWSEEKASPLKN